MRLIDAEHLERRLKELGWFEPDEFDREIKLKCILDQEPTAYDVDKVVGRLEEKILNTSDTQLGISARMAFGKAIKVVKSGGIE